MMSLTLALTHPEQICGVVAHSGYLPEHTPLEYCWDSLGHTSFFIAHGTQDPVVPVAMARRTAELLKPTGAPLTYREYSIPHTISDESLDEINQWLRRMLDGIG
jgi:phospholipase/carboxylesterase